MAIENRELTPGTRLVATYKKAHHGCIVTAGEDGKAVFTLDDGRAFKSPSAAASAVMGGTACNGWRFWTPEGELKAPPAKEPKAKTGGNGKPPSPATVRNIKRVPNQKGVVEGNTRWFCDGCMAGFEYATYKGAPEACPQGHPAVTAEA